MFFSFVVTSENKCLETLQCGIYDLSRITWELRSGLRGRRWLPWARLASCAPRLGPGWRPRGAGAQTWPRTWSPDAPGATGQDGPMLSQGI